jgi:uncharacterized protein YfkK (UPF0435 family)
MNLENATQENIEYIVNAMAKQLAVVNASILNPKHYGTESYEDLLDIYYMITKKKKLTLSELDAVLSELGKLRKK